MEATINILLQSEKYINTNIPQDKIHNLLITCLSIGKEYAHLPEVEGVTIGGSLGRGLHDEKSDIEMYIIL